MRLRPLVALSIATASVVLLAGCTGTAAETAPTSTETVDLCDAAVDPGDASNAVQVTGDPGTLSTATFTAPLEVPELQATVIAEGEGDHAASGDFILYAMSAFDAETGELLDSIGYEPGQLLPQQISADTPLGSVLGCGAAGERVVAAFPAGESSGAAVYILDLLSIVPNAAWGAAQDPVKGMPTVKLAEGGTPTITIPDSDPPTETTLATLKEGDGITVESGDQVLLQYMGVRWSDGEEFDSTWSKGGTPTELQTTGVVAGFQQALEGATVGSQVLVVIPPQDGYGEGEINETDLKGETLVFVVDILGTQHPTTQ
ncbi:FKBP-type peptidyl-prolyl cis-trans isomerase [Microbacterium sp.]|uniref:FKBP-type peptidyl-prolyl cis-trans isomerase n=1 Tax=Microbacterium sp. TaxID=51671 RepID=UPI0039E67B73